MIDLAEASQTPQAQTCDNSTHETDSFFKSGGFKGFLRETIKGIISFQIYKWSAYFLMAALFGGVMAKDSIKDLSSMLALDDYFGAFELFQEKAKVNIYAINKHKVYSSGLLSGMGKAKGINYKRLFWVVKIEGVEYLMMRQPVQDVDDEYLKLDESAYLASDALGYCDDMGGIVPTRKLVIQASQLKANFIRGPKNGEVFRGEGLIGPFRCVLKVSEFL